MKRNSRKLEILLSVIIALLLFNTAMQIVFFRYNHIDNSTSGLHRPLPDKLTVDLMDSISNRLVFEFNNDNWTGFYNLFGSYAQSQFSLEDVKNEFSKLKPPLGNIETHAYSHYRYAGDKELSDWFEVIYKSRFTNGIGIIKYTYRVLEGEPEIIGINIELQEL